MITFFLPLPPVDSERLYNVLLQQIDELNAEVQVHQKHRVHLEQLQEQLTQVPAYLVVFTVLLCMSWYSMHMEVRPASHSLVIYAMCAVHMDQIHEVKMATGFETD